MTVPIADKRGQPVIPSRGVYAVLTADKMAEQSVITAAGAAIRGGVAMLQYRAKTLSRDQKHRQAEQLVELCRSHPYAAVPLIINDDVDLADRVDADGVHLGDDDGSTRAARRRLGDGAIIGVSCYASLERAQAAERDGASYVAFGRLFPSRTKPAAPPCAMHVITNAANCLTIPLVGIGGIDANNASTVVEAGASMVAVVSAVFDNDDPEQAARQIVNAVAVARASHGIPTHTNR